MSERKQHGLIALAGGAAGLGLLAAILIAGNIIVGNLRMRMDLTEEKLYTLSPGSRALLGKLDQDVTLKFFYSASAANVPVFIKNYARQVQDLLAEYRIAGRGRVIVETYDPKPDSDAEEWAQSYGVSGQPLEAFGAPFYFGVVAVAAPQEAALPVLDPRTENLLEYNLTRLIHRVTQPAKPIIGVLSSLPVLGSAAPQMSPFAPPPPAQEAWVAFADLRDDYTLRELQPTVERIDDDIEALVVVHPKELGEKTQYALDQFVLRGGRLVVLVDPLCATEAETAQANPFGMPQNSSDLARLFAAWGVGYDPGQVAADPALATRIRGMNNQIEDSPVWISLQGDRLDRSDVLTANLESALLPYAGVLSDKTGDAVTFTPLIRTAENAGPVNAMMARFGSSAVLKELKRSPTPLTLAARLTGTFTTAFPAGAPRDAADTNGTVETATAAHLTNGQGVVTVIADCDFIYDRFAIEKLNFFGATAYSPINDNLALFANLVEQIAGSTDLIAIRTRGRSVRPFDRVVALQQGAMLEWQAQANALEQRLAETQRQLRELEQTKQDQGQKFILSPEQKAAIERFKTEENETRAQLKTVRKNLRRDIEQLGLRVKLINIAAMPLLLIVTGIGFGVRRARRAARARAAA